MPIALEKDNEVYKIENRQKINFIQKPHCAIFELSANSNRVYDFYIAASFDKCQSFYSLNKISMYLDIDKKTLIKANKELEEKKYIQIIKRQNNSNVVILLHKDSDNFID